MLSLSDMIDKLIADKVIAGASYAYLTKNETDLYYKGRQGFVSPFSDTNIDEKAKYDLASLTKVVATTTRILQLIEAGELCMSIKVSDILTSFELPTITIEHLLLHTSGLPADFSDKKELNKEMLMSKINALENIKMPGQVSVYSDVGYILLGFVIEQIDEMSLESSYQTHIFKKLGMNHTSYKVEADIQRYVPTECSEQRGCIQAVVHDSKAFQLGEIGSAGIFSSLNDLMVFAKSILFDNMILSEKSKKSLIETTMFHRTYGWDKRYGNAILYHTGFTGTSMLINIEEGTAVILLTNQIHPKRGNTKFMEAREEINQMVLNKEIK